MNCQLGLAPPAQARQRQAGASPAGRGCEAHPWAPACIHRGGNWPEADAGALAKRKPDELKSLAGKHITCHIDYEKLKRDYT